jgi:hypothetical protein
MYWFEMKFEIFVDLELLNFLKHNLSWSHDLWCHYIEKHKNCFPVMSFEYHNKLSTKMWVSYGGKYRRPVGSVGWVSVCCAGGRESNPGRTNTQGLKITEEKVLPLQSHLQTVRLSSGLDDHLKSGGPVSPHFTTNQYWRDVKEPLRT